MPSVKARATYREKNREKLRQASRDRYARDPVRHQQVCDVWRANNRGAHLAWRALRRAQKLNATLPGYEDELRAIYNNRPEGHEVDHIIPLVHPLVCGLHVPWNLQYLLADVNRRKSNSFTPP